MKKRVILLDKLSAQIQNAQVQNKEVSEGTIGWHIEHSALVIIKIAETVQKSDPNHFESTFSIKRVVVFLLGKFPRGKAKAPSSVMPAENISEEHLKESIFMAKMALQSLMDAAKNQHFAHPIFGNLNRNQTLKFLGIHTKHHLSIIADILK